MFLEAESFNCDFGVLFIEEFQILEVDGVFGVINTVFLDSFNLIDRLLMTGAVHGTFFGGADLRGVSNKRLDGVHPLYMDLFVLPLLKFSLLVDL